MVAYKAGRRVRVREDANFDGYSHATDYEDVQRRRAVGILKHNVNGIHYTVRFDTGLWLFRADDLEMVEEIKKPSP